MGQTAQSAIKPLNAAGNAIGFAMRSVPPRERCHIAALNKAELQCLNGRSQVAHRCLWTHRPISTGRRDAIASALHVQEIEQVSARELLQGEHDSLLDPGFGSRSGRQFEGRDGPSGTGDAPRPETAPDADDGAVAVEEDDVDREAHEPRVHRRGGAEQDPLLGSEVAPAEQTAHALQRTICQKASFTYHDVIQRQQGCFARNPL
jgi:hypothetical protein